MAQQDLTAFVNTFNDSGSGLFKDNVIKAIGADDSRTLVQNIADSFLNLVDGGTIEGFVNIGTTGTVPISATNMTSKIATNSTSGSTINAIFYVEQTVGTTGSPQGVEGYVETSNPSGTVVLSIATIGNLEHSGAGTVSYGRSVQAGGILSGAGIITDLVGLFSTFAITGSGTITTYYGCYLEAPSAGGGTITNRYGVYSADANARNYFAGDMTIAGDRINVAGLPTSSAGLASGDLWVNSGVLTRA